MKNQKKQFGQFFTKNSDYILNNLSKYIKGKKATDPFAGNGDLMLWAKKFGAKKVIGYDVDRKYINKKTILNNDSLNNPLEYDFVITNPPYLNINKASKTTKEKYFGNHHFEDLYHAALFSIMKSNEGIVIVPINFLSALNSKKIREIFFSKFKIVEMNYFKQQVFADTTYNVISFYYKKKKDLFDDNFIIKTHIYPEKNNIEIELKKTCGWAIGGDLLKAVSQEKNFLGIRRLTEKDLNKLKGDIEIEAAYNHVKDIKSFKISKQAHDLIKSNVILLKAIDSGSEEGKIALENIKTKYGVECLVSKESSRHMVYLIFSEKISIAEQEKIIELFNKEINHLRDNYLSLFLTNYRDKDRKRVSFNFAYKFINHIYKDLHQIDAKESNLFSLSVKV